MVLSLFFFIQSPRKVCIANRNIGQKFVFLKQIYFSYSSLCCLFYQARHLRRWDQSAVSILYLKQFADPGLQVIRHHSSVCRCGIADFIVFKASCLLCPKEKRTRTT